MSWILEYFVVYSLCVYIYYVRLVMLSDLLFCRIVYTLMLGVSHAIQNEKKL